ncbi:cytochrome P450 [Alkalicoccus daliensis]|uniref:Fatty-acid peroxygenase n=1 Tax=Alkalicoccus daliensis TaxID=745820 RepID=A0A1H0E2S6_9BACI|nr:cytochrome P450 [Alkalicoccus daliensis]SDN76588.1 fatty-acid peroxygenase [Alkalicoccus daliensis]
MKVKTPIPKTKGFDKTKALIQEGFHFLPSHREELQSDIFKTRIAGQKTICMAGEEAAEVFYDNDKFKRKGAIPKPLRMTLTGEGAIHGMDGEAHKQRKRMFLSMMTPERLEDMKKFVVEELDTKSAQWESRDKVILFDEMEEILTRAACRWAGVPLSEGEVQQRTKELSAMVDSFGGTPQQYKDGRKARKSQEKWLADYIKQIRKGKVEVPAYTPAYIVAHHVEANGKKLDTKTAAVSLNNAFRPLLAAVHFITFGAMAIHQNPEIEEKLRKDKNNYSQWFTQEVRRYFPFAPAMGAKVKNDFHWHGQDFKKNTLVILDLFGTNRHPDSWEKADEFIPERFKDWKESPFAFVPFGGGDHHIGHRCAGEWMTVMVMRAVFQYLTNKITYRVPEQNLEYDLRRMPTMPKSGFVMTEVKKVESSEDIEEDMSAQPVIRN